MCVRVTVTNSYVNWNTNTGHAYFDDVLIEVVISSAKYLFPIQIGWYLLLKC